MAAPQRSPSPPKPPVTQEDVRAVNTVEDLSPAPDPATVQVPGGFAPPGELNNENDLRYIQPDVSQKPKSSPTAVSSMSIEEALGAALGEGGIQKLIEAGVSQYLARNGMEMPQGGLNDVVAERSIPKPTFEFKKHYRCDAYPDLRIPELDMTADTPQLAPVIGSVIQFRRGHFFATTDNQVKQIEFMRNSPTHSADGNSVVGGLPSIFEDDGEVIYSCTQGCTNFHTANLDRYRIHMRDRHNVTV